MPSSGFLRSYHVVALCAIALLSLGLVMVTSAGMELASPAKAADSAPLRAAQDPSVSAATPPASKASSPTSIPPLAPAREMSLRDMLLTTNGAFMAISLLAMAAAAMLPVRLLARKAQPAMLIAGGRGQILEDRWAGIRTLAVGCAFLLGLLLLVYLAGLGKSVKGAERWLRVPVPGLGLVSVQPSEIAKWTMVGLIAWYSTRRAAILHTFWLGLTPALIGIGAVAALIVKEDLGTGVLIGAAASLVLIAAGARFWHFLLLSPIAAAAIAAAVATSAYRVRRITAFLDPYADPRETGYHMIQSMGAISSGGLFGKGLGNGVQKFGYLPEDTNDFIFAIICEELGAPGALIVIGLFILLLWAAWGIVSRERNRLLQLFGMGILATIGLQALINLTVVTAMGPTKGIALPLVSAGGTGWTLTAFCLGIVIAIGRTQERLATSDIHRPAMSDWARRSPEPAA